MLNLLLLFILITSIFVVISTNPIHSLLYLVLTFINVSILLLILNCEFLSFLFLIVYIGAVIVLFLFIVMMLNVKIIELDSKIIKYIPIGLFIIFIFLIEIYYIIDLSLISNLESSKLDIMLLNLDFINYYNIYWNYFNIDSISQLLFTKFIFMFILAGLILLVAMIGAIFLTLNHTFLNKRQDIYKQINIIGFDRKKYFTETKISETNLTK